MIEVLSHLRANQFETYIVTGGGQVFHRQNDEASSAMVRAEAAASGGPRSDR